MPGQPQNAEKQHSSLMQRALWGVVVVCFISVSISVGYIALVFAGALSPRWSTSASSREHSQTASLPLQLLSRTVQIRTTYVSNGMLMPWTKLPFSSSPAIRGLHESLSSGFVLDPEKKLILVSDLVARDASEMYAIRNTDGQRFEAEVLLMAEDAHLALIRVSDVDFWNSLDVRMNVLDFSAELPAVSTPVQMSGYFAGEMAVAVQTASVSELQFGVGGSEASLGRNKGPGSFYAKVHPEPDKEFSAGPVFSLINPTGPLLGFMALGVGKSNFIPGPVVHRVLQEYYSSGKWSGFAPLGIHFRALEARPMRAFWRLDEGPHKVGGVMVRSVAPTSAAAHAGVRKGDVLIAIDDRAVHQDGTVAVRVGDHESNFPLDAAAANKKPGDAVKLSLLRPSAADAKTGAQHLPTAFVVNLKLSPPDPLIRKLSGNGPKPGLGKRPSYFSVGNLVFTIVTQDLLEAMGEKVLPQETQVQILQRWRRNPTEEVVLFLRGFQNDCNAHYPLTTSRVLTHFNGKEVANLEDLLRQVGAVVSDFERKAAASGEVPSVGTGCGNDSDFLEFTFLPDANKDTGGSITGDPDIVLLTSCAQEHSAQGMVAWVSQYGALPVSSDLFGPYSEAILSGNSVVDTLGGEAAALALLGPGFLQGNDASDNQKGRAQVTETEAESLLEQELDDKASAYNCAMHFSKSESASRQIPPKPSSQRRLLASLSNEPSLADAMVPLSLIENSESAESFQGLSERKATASVIRSHEARSFRFAGSRYGTHGVGAAERQERQKPKPNLPMKNVVKILSVNREPSFTSPWTPSGQFGARCTGIIMDVKQRFILTCAHCVGDSELLFVTREDFPRDTVARVVEVAHDLDLAWLTADNSDGFWDHVEVQNQPISTELPGYGSEVQVVGYPIGGTAITQTLGVISRVDAQVYPNGLDPDYRNAPSSLLVLQVDAAINSGNSGGPAFSADGELVGIAFAGLNHAQNVGYVIPSTIVRTFVEAVVHGGQQWVAQSELGVRVKAMQNPSLRAFWGLSSEDHGVQLRTVAPLSGLAAAGLRKTDILLSVDGVNVTDIGEVSYPGGHDNFLVDLDVLISQKQRNVPGGEARLKDLQFIGSAELIGAKNVKAQDPMRGSPKTLSTGFSGGASGTQHEGANMLIVNSGQADHGQNLDAPSWSNPDYVKMMPTDFVFLRRDCEKGKAKISRIPASVNVGPVSPLVPRFNDKAVGLSEDKIGRRKAADLGFAAIPTYFEMGGLVWTVLSQPLLEQLKAVPQATALCLYRWKRDVAEKDPEQREFGGCGAETEEVVVLLKGLDHPLNLHYEKGLHRVLRYFNGEPVVSLKGLIGQVGTAIITQNPYMSFTFEPLDDGADLAGGRNDPDIVLNTKDVVKAAHTGEILQAYGLQNPVSSDLQETYVKAMTPPSAATGSNASSSSP